MQKNVHRRGLGLIETIIAMGLLVTAVTVLMSLVISSSAARTENEYATVAVNLAREGVEVFVAQRDTNWINDQPFDTGMYVGTDYTFGAAFAPATATWSFVNNPAGGAPNLVTDALARVYIYNSGVNTGLMVQGTVAVPQPANTIATIYNRLVTADAICYNGTVESFATSGSTCGANTKIGIRLNSTVQWTDRGNTHSTSIIETLYDWR